MGRFGTRRRYPSAHRPLTVSDRQREERDLGRLRTNEGGYTRYGVTPITEVRKFRSPFGETTGLCALTKGIRVLWSDSPFPPHASSHGRPGPGLRVASPCRPATPGHGHLSPPGLRRGPGAPRLPRRAGPVPEDGRPCPAPRPLNSVRRPPSPASPTAAGGAPAPVWSSGSVLGHGPVARSTTARLTGPSPAAVTEHCARLSGHGPIREPAVPRPPAGSPRSRCGGSRTPCGPSTPTTTTTRRRPRRSTRNGPPSAPGSPPSRTAPRTRWCGCAR